MYNSSKLRKWKVKVKVTQSCPTLCNPMDNTVHGILQATILEWVTFPFSRGSSQPRDGAWVSCIAGGFLTSWATREAREYWRLEAIPSAEGLPNPGLELGSPALQVDSLPTELPGKPPSEVEITQSCPALCDQARILEWVAFPLSGGSPQPRDWIQISRMAGGFFTSRAIRGAK